MKVLVDIKDDKAAFFMEIIKNFKFVRAEPLTEADSKFYDGLKEAVKEVQQVKKGAASARSAEDFLNELL